MRTVLSFGACVIRSFFHERCDQLFDIVHNLLEACPCLKDWIKAVVDPDSDGAITREEAR